MKVCKKCEIEKEESHFNKSRGECKECMSIYKKEYAVKNAEKIRAYQSKFRESETYTKYQSEYRLKNADSIKEYKKKYYEENSDSVNKYLRDRYSKRQDVRDKCKEYRDLNKEKSRDYSKIYYNINKDEILSGIYKNKKNRIKNDSLFRLYIRVSGTIRDSISRGGYTKKSRTHEILGCSFEEFKVYIESKFESWMTWDNRGLYNGELNYGWDIDHIIPTSSAKSEEDLYRLNHYTNLQPLCSYTNRVIKRDRIDD